MVNIDNKIQLRNLLLTEIVEGVDSPMIKTAVFNALPIDKNDGGDSIINFGDYVDFDGMLPVIKPKTPKVIKDFINAQLTNEVNRLLKSKIGPVQIDDYVVDRNELIEAARNDEDYKKFIDEISPRFKEKFEYIKSNIDDIEEFIGSDVIKMLVYPTLLKAVFLKQSVIPRNSRLEKGEPHRVLANTNLYKILNLDENDRDVIIFTDKDNQYFITNSVYAYPVIRKMNFDDFFRISIG